MSEIYDIAIVGAGLSAMSVLRAGDLGAKTIVLEHRDTLGGFLLPALPAEEFSDAWDLVQSFRMPAHCTAQFGATVVGLLPAFSADEPHTLVVRLRQGTMQVQARKIVIASGGLERTREHSRIPGTRPAGVITPIFAHQLLSRGYLPGQRAVVYGASRYAAVTVRRLADAGVTVTSFAPAAAQGVGEVAELVEVKGFPHLESLRMRRGSEYFDQPADTLVYAHGMLANTHWLKGSGVTTRPDGSVEVDAHYQTNIAGIYAVGTVVSPSLDHTDSLTMGKEVGSLLAGGQL